MKILVVGNGGREHAITMALSRSKTRCELNAYMAVTNPAIAALCSKTQLGSMKTPEAIADFAWQNRVDLAIVGPEEPLVHGAADALHRKGIPTIGPRQELARLEGDKTFLRAVVARWAPEANPGFAVCHSAEEVRTALADLGDVAVKPLGLTSGKGVRVMGIQLATAADADYEVEQGISFVGINALVMRRYMHEFGWKHEDFAPFSINSHANAMHNPYARLHEKISTEKF